MPVIDQEDYPNDLPHGSQFRGAVPFDYAALDGGTERANAQLDVADALIAWIFAQRGGERACRPSRLPARIGVRMAALLWVMHPDRMPWAKGQALSERQVAAALNINRGEFSEIAADITRRLGLRNAYQAHGRVSAGKREIRANQTPIGLKESFSEKVRAGAAKERGFPGRKKIPTCHEKRKSEPKN